MKQFTTNSTITTGLLDKVMALRWQDGPLDLPLLIKQSLVDWLGVSIAAAADLPVQALREELEEQGGHPQAFLDLVGPAPYAGFQSALDSTVVHGWNYYWKSTRIPRPCD